MFSFASESVCLVRFRYGSQTKISPSCAPEHGVLERELDKKRRELDSDPVCVLLWDLQKYHTSSESLFYHPTSEKVGKDDLYLLF